MPARTHRVQCVRRRRRVQDEVLSMVDAVTDASCNTNHKADADAHYAHPEQDSSASGKAGRVRAPGRRRPQFEFALKVRDKA